MTRRTGLMTLLGLGLALAVAVPAPALGDASGADGEGWFGRVAGVLHPLMVHFPIALLIAGALAELMALIVPRWTWLHGGSRWCLWVGALGSIGAAISGWEAAELQGYSDESVFTHRWLGVSTSGLSLAVLIVYEAWRAWKARWLGVVTGAGLAAVALLVGLTGHYGGMLVYGEDYFDPLFRPSAAPTAPGAGEPADGDAPAASAAFVEQVKPILDRYCAACHSGRSPRGNINLRTFAGEEDLYAAPHVGLELQRVISEKTMPPRTAPQPSDAERQTVLDWLEEVRAEMQAREQGDPGKVVMPRLTGPEYDNVIRDLTGVTVSAAAHFPREGGGGEGFSNVGEAQSITPQLLRRYLDAAKQVLRHARITPAGGIRWLARELPPAKLPRELRDAIVRQRIDWFVFQNERQTWGVHDRTDEAVGLRHAAYVDGAWHYKHRAALGNPEAGFAEVAENYPGRLSAAVLANWWGVLTAEDVTSMVRELQDRFEALPAPKGPGDQAAVEEVRSRCQAIEEWIAGARKHLNADPPYDKSPNPARNNPQDAREKVFLDKLHKQGCFAYILDVSELDRLYLTATDAGDGNDGEVVIWRNGRFVDGRDDRDGEPWQQTLSLSTPDGEAVRWGSHPRGRPVGPGAVGVSVPGVLTLDVPDGATWLRVEACVDPNGPAEASVQTVVLDEPPGYRHFYPGRWVYGLRRDSAAAKAVRDAQEEFREMIDTRQYAAAKTPALYLQTVEGLDLRFYGGPWPDQAKRFEKINRHKPMRPYYLTFEQRVEAAPEEARQRLSEIDRDLALLAQGPHQDMQALLLEQGYGDAAEGVTPAAEIVNALDANARARYDALLAGMLRLEQTFAESAREQIGRFARRAWRRPVQPDQIERLYRLYRGQREAGRSYESSMKLAISAVLVSPHFIYRYHKVPDGVAPAPLDDFEVASRLSFFLWGSGPDEALLASAKRGELSDDQTLLAQTRRMLDDPRSRALGSLFAAQWLHFAYFHEYTTPDDERFPEYDEALRRAMYEESVLFFEDLFSENRPATNIWRADYSFLNERLAEHYGIDGVKGERMRRVAVPVEQRGGVLGMGSILTSTSTSLRTSPVLRGTWILDHLLGTPVPDPPPNIPMLSDDETDAGGLSIREQLERHRADPACAGCHAKLDPPGMSLENFDPIGRWRTTYLSGNPVDATGETPEGSEIRGLAGLRAHLDRHRRKVLHHFCRKLLGYALGRAVTVGDEPLLDEMYEDMKADDWKVAALLERIVTSRQFRYRSPDTPTARR